MSDCVIRLKSGLWEASIDPNYGGNIVSLTRSGQPVLRGIGEFTGDPFLVGAPLLLPANRTAGGTFSFGGHTYRLPITEARSGANLHGSLYNAPFMPVSATENQAVLRYENQGEIYPFPFRITLDYRLTVEGLATSYTLENTGDTAMPFTFGIHTTFREPEWFSVPLTERQEKDALHIPSGRYLPLTDEEATFVTGSPSKGKAISGFYRAGGNTAVAGDYTYRVQGFDHWVLYNGGGQSGFLCLEPQLGRVDGLNHPESCPVLLPGEKRTLLTHLTYTGREGRL